MSSIRLQLNKGADRRLKQGHLWIYSNEIDTRATPLAGVPAGEQVRIVSHEGKVLGTAMINPATLICGRLISRLPDQFMDKGLLVHRLNMALSAREAVFDAPFYRLVFGDSDGLPGLVVDRFDDVCVVQISLAGMERLRGEVVAALIKVVNPVSIVFKNDGKMREVEGLSSYAETAYGPPVEETRIQENGVNFVAPVLAGQKTGWFFDHRMGRDRLRAYVKGKRVLDVFSYVGGWGVQAAAFGAREVVCVDSSALALSYVERNANLNGVSDRVRTLEGDAFSLLKQLRDERERFDVIIVDPPAFIPKRKDIKTGEQAYQRLNQLALRLLERDGILVSGSCSMHLSRERLIDIIRSVGRETDRFVQILEQTHQGADHPIIPAIPETEYLKAVFARSLPSF